MKCFGFITLILLAVCLNAQNSMNVEVGLFKIYTLVPSASYELGLCNNSTLNFDALLIPGVRGGSDRDTEYGILLGAQVDFR